MDGFLGKNPLNYLYGNKIIFFFTLKHAFQDTHLLNMVY